MPRRPCPGLLAMLCILAVFMPSFFMEGAARSLFVPLSLAVGFSMVASYILSSTFVPVLSVWLLRHAQPRESETVERFRSAFRGLLEGLIARRGLLVPAYLAACALVLVVASRQLGTEIFPLVDAGEFRLRMRAPDGTHFERTEQLALEVLKVIEEKVGRDNVAITLGYVGTIPSTYPINAVFQWMRGPEEGLLRVALKGDSGIRIDRLKEDLRRELAERMPQVRFSFEPADVINEVMSFGSTTPIDVAVSGPNMAENRAYAERLHAQLAKIDSLRDLQFGQSLDYPTIDVRMDREKAGLSGVVPSDVARSLVAATSSSRFVVPNYWPDPKTGIGYQVQVQIPQARTQSIQDLETVPVKRQQGKDLLLEDVADVKPGSMPGEFDRYNMRRQISLTANTYGEDLGTVSGRVSAAIGQAGALPKGANLDVRGQIPPMQQLFQGLAVGLGLAVVAIFLLLAANFQSLRLALATVSTVPAVVVGVVDRAARNAHHAEHPIVHRRDHGDRRGHGQRHPAGYVCRGSAPRRRRRRAGGARWSDQPRAADSHDQHGDDRRHGAHGPGDWPRKRANGPLGPRGDRRTSGRHDRHAVCPAAGVRAGAIACQQALGVARSLRPRESLLFSGCQPSGSRFRMIDPRTTLAPAPPG